MKNVVILGSTGSIGRNTLEVIQQLGGEYRVYALSARSQLELLAQQLREFQPRRAALADQALESDLRRHLGANSVDFLTGETALVELARDPEADIVVNALVGAVGLRATLAALESGKILALANKESIVMAGGLVLETAQRSNATLIPVDSEHSALFQCLHGENPERVKRLHLTASGGPFLRLPLADFEGITPKAALRHPTWQMGSKITVDSATLMNKGLEVIEAHYLFAQPPESISVVIHPQSVVHSLVEFLDGSFKAQLSMPDMRLPIQYALTYPDRAATQFTNTDLTRIGVLQFERPDDQRFPCLKLAYQALRAGTGHPTALNAANEIAVGAFLAGDLSFNSISKIIHETLAAFAPPGNLDLTAILEMDRWAREFSASIINAKRTSIPISA